LFVNENPFAGSQRRAADVDGRRHLRSSGSANTHGAAGRSTNSAHDTRRPRLSRGCGQSMELPSANDHGLTVAADVPPTT